MAEAGAAGAGGADFTAIADREPKLPEAGGIGLPGMFGRGAEACEAAGSIHLVAGAGTVADLFAGTGAGLASLVKRIVLGAEGCSAERQVDVLVREGSLRKKIVLPDSPSDPETVEEAGCCPAT